MQVSCGPVCSLRHLVGNCVIKGSCSRWDFSLIQWCTFYVLKSPGSGCSSNKIANCCSLATRRGLRQMAVLSGWASRKLLCLPSETNALAISMLRVFPKDKQQPYQFSMGGSHSLPSQTISLAGMRIWSSLIIWKLLSHTPEWFSTHLSPGYTFKPPPQQLLKRKAGEPTEVDGRDIGQNKKWLLHSPL